MRIRHLEYLCRDPGAEIKALRKEVERHNRLYHEKNKPEISDPAFDRLVKELERLEKKHPVGKRRARRELLAELRESLHHIGTPGPKLSEIIHVTIFGACALIQGCDAFAEGWQLKKHGRLPKRRKFIMSPRCGECKMPSIVFARSRRRFE